VADSLQLLALSSLKTESVPEIDGYQKV